MNIIICLSTIVLITFLGYILVTYLLPTEDVLVKFGYSYGLGVGIVTLWMYMLTRLEVSWTRELLITPWVIIIFAFLYMNRRKVVTIPHIHLTKLHILLLAGILLSFCYVSFEAVLRPVTAWDGWAIWLLRSKIFFIDNMVNPEILKQLESDYPLGISLLGTFVYKMLGKVNDSAVLLTSVGFYISCAIVLFAEIRKRFGVNYGLCITFLFVTVQTLVRHGGRLEAGQADLPFGYYALICSTLLLSYLKNTSGRYAITLCIFLGLITSIKHEGIPFSLCIVLIILLEIYRKKLYQHIFLFIFWLIPLIDWQIYIHTNSLKNNYLSSQTYASFQEIISITIFTIKEFFTIKSWGLLWIVYFYSLIVINHKKHKEIFILNYIILSQLVLYFTLYVLSPQVYTPESSWQRLLVHIAPIALLVIAFVSKQVKVSMLFTLPKK